MKKNVKNLTLSAMFIALGLVLPLITGEIQQIGNMLLPMHIPVLLCGFICGWAWGGLVGAVLPPLRFLIFGMPPIYPTAVAMAFELCAYGVFTGLIYAEFKKRGTARSGRLTPVNSEKIGAENIANSGAEDVTNCGMENAINGSASSVNGAENESDTINNDAENKKTAKKPANIVAIYVSLISAMLIGRVVWGVVTWILYGAEGEAFTFSMFLSSAFLEAVPGIILQLILIPAIMVALQKSKLIKY